MSLFWWVILSRCDTSTTARVMVYISRCGEESEIKALQCSSSSRVKVLRGSGLQSGAAGVGAVPSLMAVTFLRSSSWLHCTAVDGACDSRAIPWALRSAPSEPSLSLYTLTVKPHTYITVSPPSPPPPPHSGSRHTQAFCTTTSASRGSWRMESWEQFS